MKNKATPVRNKTKRTYGTWFWSGRVLTQLFAVLRHKMQTTSGDTPKVARYDKGENYELFWFGSLSFPDYVYILCPKELFVKGFL